MKVYELINALLTMPAGADVRAINGDDREALVLFVVGVEHIAEHREPDEIDPDAELPLDSPGFAALNCVPESPKG